MNTLNVHCVWQVITLRWSNEVTLVAEKPPEKPTNEHGFPNPAITEETTIFCNELSIGTNEFYKAAKEGFNRLIKLEVHTEEFSDEPKAKYNDVDYFILRTYAPPSKPDITELTLSDLPRGGKTNG